MKKKLKIIEIAVLAAAAIISAIKSLIKFLKYADDLKRKTAV